MTGLFPDQFTFYLCIMNRLLVIVLVLFISSCEKSISFRPESRDQAVVVEATIENGEPPMVILTRTFDYFSELSVNLFENSFIRNAEVTISNGSQTQKLREYSAPAGGIGYVLYYYTIDSSNLANAFKGELGKNYSMEIKVDGKAYTAKTTIPALAKTADSVWWQKAPDHPDTTKTVVMVRTTDPPGLGNYIRYFTKVNNQPFFPGLNSVFDDQIVDGKTYSIQVDRGVDRNAEFDIEEYAFFTRGDSVTLKLTNIDKATFDFWRTMEYSYQSIGNPFSSPTKVLGNIQGGALGYFGGYAVQYLSIVIPK